MLETGEVYWERMTRYWRQAREHLERGELSKATELAWGSLVQALRATAAAHGKEVGDTHRDVRRYAQDLAGSTGDEEMFRFFKEAEAAHSNFYQEFMDSAQTREVIAKIEQAIAKLSRLIFRDNI